MIRLHFLDGVFIAQKKFLVKLNGEGWSSVADKIISDCKLCFGEFVIESVATILMKAESEKN